MSVRRRRNAEVCPWNPWQIILYDTCNGLGFIPMLLTGVSKIRPSWAASSVGRALHSHCRGQEFESPAVHQKTTTLLVVVFLFHVKQAVWFMVGVRLLPPRVLLSTLPWMFHVKHVVLCAARPSQPAEISVSRETSDFVKAISIVGSRDQQGVHVKHEQGCFTWNIHSQKQYHTACTQFVAQI